MIFPGAPSRPGDYRFRYAYGKWTTVDFRVVPMKLIASKVLRLAELMPFAHPSAFDKVFLLPAYAIVFSIIANGENWLLVTQGPRNEPRGLENAEGYCNVQGFVRVVQSESPIVEIGGVAHVGDELALTWTDFANRISSITLDRRRRPVAQ